MTTLAAPPTAFGRETFDAYVERLVEPAWVTERRQAAFDSYTELHGVELDPEEFKRVDLRILRPEKFALQTDASESAGFETRMQQARFAGHVAHVDGHCVRSELSEELAAKGVLFGDLATLLREHGDVLEPHLMTRGVRPETDRFSAWHAAYFTGGTVLYVPRGVVVKEALHSLIAHATDGVADFCHTLVVLEQGAEAVLLEETASANDDLAGLHVGAVELLLAPESRLRYVQLQNWNEKSFHFAHQSGRVEKDARLQWTVGGIGGKLAHVHQNVELDGRGADAEVNGVTFAIDKQKLSYFTQQTHHSPDTRSDLLYKEVLRDKARVVWRGMIKVDADAQRTDGFQRCDGLILSDDARADSVPGLEIEADDVRCTHAATAGRVDEEEIFYCTSRGLSEYEAMHMIVEGYFHEVYDRIAPSKRIAGWDDECDTPGDPLEVVRDTLSAAVLEKLDLGD